MKKIHIKVCVQHHINIIYIILYIYIYIYTDILQNNGIKITTELLKCPNHPQGSNGSTYGFKCCHHHVQKFIEKGLKCNQIDKYLNWRWCKTKIKGIEEKIRKLKESDNNYRNEKIRLTDKIKKIENYMKNKFTTIDTKAFNDILWYNRVRRTSTRSKSDKEAADYNECMQQENDNEDLEQWERIMQEKNVHPDYVHFAHRMYIICMLEFMANLILIYKKSMKNCNYMYLYIYIYIYRIS